MLKIERIYKIKDGANIGIKLLVEKFGLYKSNKLTKNFGNLQSTSLPTWTTNA